MRTIDVSLKRNSSRQDAPSPATLFEAYPVLEILIWYRIQSDRIAHADPKRNTALLAVIAGIAVIVALAAFSGGLLSLIDRWSRQEEYSHGFLIPVVAAWMLWSRREALVASIGKPSLMGPARHCSRCDHARSRRTERILSSHASWVHCRPFRHCAERWWHLIA